MEYIESLLTILFVCVVFVGVLYLAYKTTKFVGVKYNTMQGMSKNIKVIDKAMLSQGQSLVVVQVGEKTMLLGCTQNNITTLAQLDTQDIKVEEPKQPDIAFGSLFNKIIKAKNKEGLKNNDETR